MRLNAMCVLRAERDVSNKEDTFSPLSIAVVESKAARFDTSASEPEQVIRSFFSRVTNSVKMQKKIHFHGDECMQHNSLTSMMCSQN